MKYLILIGLLALLFFVLGFKRARPPQPPVAGKARDSAPQDMLSCAHCGLHLPRDEALPGQGGVFCSAAHRASYEAEHGGGR
ncbi:PP0621 family protein [Roseateles sp.]|uniref:PP0621 family protein n=1 Tax=Roseateles sp. TaxID=1971397 RepID=UPI003D0CBF2C